MSQLQPLSTPMYDARVTRPSDLVSGSSVWCMKNHWHFILLRLASQNGDSICGIAKVSIDWSIAFNSTHYSWFIIHQLSLTGGFMDPFICIIRSFHRFFSYVRRIPPPKKKHQDFMVHVSIAAHLPWPTKVTFVHRLRGAPEASKAPTPAETPSGAGAEPRETQRLLALEVRNLGTRNPVDHYVGCIPNLSK